jgi:hypothetical protein
MKITKIILIVISLLISWSCKDDSNPIIDPPVIQEGVIMPLAVGNQWKFVDSLFNQDGVFTGIKNTRLEITESVQLNIDGKLKPYYNWQWFDDSSSTLDSSKLLCANSENGFYFFAGIHGEDTTIFNQPSLYAKYPIKENETWNWHFNMYVTTADTGFYTVVSYEMNCISINKSIETPFGKIDCIVYEYIDSSISGARNYYVPNVGLVGREEIWHGVIRVKKLLREANITN